MSGNNSHLKDWKEGRRKGGFELRVLGSRPCKIADALGVSRAAVSRWFAKAGNGRVELWRAKSGPSGPIKLSSEQLDSILEILSHGAEAYGFFGDVWTCSRVATVIWEGFGVSYHKAHV